MLVALTRERGHNGELRKLVGDRADVVEVPLTVTIFRSPREVEQEIHSLESFGKFRSLVVTSGRCESYLTSVSHALSEDHNVYSVGPATTAALQRVGLVVRVEASGASLDLLDDIEHGPVLILAASEGRRELSDALASRPLEVCLVECYRTREVELSHLEVHQLGFVDVVFIGAPSAWRVARTHVAPDTWVLVPGHTTLNAVKRDHARALVGWGEEFTGAWRTISPVP